MKNFIENKDGLKLVKEDEYVSLEYKEDLISLYFFKEKILLIHANNFNTTFNETLSNQDIIDKIKTWLLVEYSEEPSTIHFIKRPDEDTLYQWCKLVVERYDNNPTNRCHSSDYIDKMRDKLKSYTNGYEII